MDSKSGSIPNPNWIYDVYLSFRGEDTRRSFVSHFYAALDSAVVSVYVDDEMLSKGDPIEHSLLRAIEASRISIVVFSKNYASSKWRLAELVKIMECRRTIGQIVVPVFYDVDPYDVRKQEGTFGEAFVKYEQGMLVEKDKLMGWRAALTEASDLSGFDLRSSRSENEGIKDIVDYVIHRLLNKTKLFVANHPVGLQFRMQDVITLLNIQQSADVLYLGIWGMGGIGKSTLARAIYNQIERYFEGSSFLPNIGENGKHDLVFSQQMILDDIYTTIRIKIHSIRSGKNIMKERLAQKRILLVLDNVTVFHQLDALCGSVQWFGPGSRIIITTRDMDLLKKHPVDHVYKMEALNENESFMLFNWHAFKQASPKKEFAELSRNIVAYSEGLPLALEEYGSLLFSREIEEWRSAWKRLKRRPHDKVQKMLKRSLDDLYENEREIFLDIACFFIGMDRNDVTYLLNGRGFFAEYVIEILVDRSLITVDDKNKLRMHNLLRDMGREIVYKESPKKPAKRSRLWVHEEVLDVLLHYEGTDAVEGLTLKMPMENAICLNSKTFEKMHRLRLLQLAGVRLDGEFKYFPRDLKWLCWDGFSLPFTPAEFLPRSLVVMKLKYSNLIQLWNSSQMLDNLKILNLSHSSALISTPDFSYLPNLEKLILKDCPSLSVVSDTIGYLKKLLLVNLKDCTSLYNLPRSIYKLKCLKTLILSGSPIDKLEKDLDQMDSLTTLIVDKTAITRVPFSIVQLKSNKCISFCGHDGYAWDVFSSRIWSWILSPGNNLSFLSQMDVFLSFREEDTHASFTSHLYTLLQNAGLTVFRDDGLHPLGEHITSLIMEAIKRSRIFVIIFSKYYAYSQRHPKELEKIMDCYRNMGQVVLPVFYKVDPSEIRHQTGKFGEAFEKLLNKLSMEEDQVLSWRMTLREASDMSGFVVQNARKESQGIKNVVEQVAHLLEKKYLFIANYPVGLKSRAQEVIQLLKTQKSKACLLLGIWGMGGIGKTAIAKYIYNQIGHDFEEKSFLLNVREVWGQNNGQFSLQEQLLFDIYETMKIKLLTVESGKMILKERLHNKRVLLVLDNVNKLEQLYALCGRREWFGVGSIIIITTRDKHLLRMLRVDHVYRVPELDQSESLELFSWHAFNQAYPKEDFVELSRKFVAFSGRLPFALVVLGSILRGKVILEWENMLKELKKIPNQEVQKVLKLSFDDLNDEEKKIFLDIACFFIGMGQIHVKDTLKRSTHSAEHGISVLLDKSLVTMDKHNKIGMHVLLRDMGREIIREESQIKSKSRIYDVFLSFRGEDTRSSFTSHLYASLQNAGIYAFKDDNNITRGHQISISLLQAIRKSRICIIVLSRNYPNSRWCMQELENIMEGHRSMGLMVVPVFYEVDPSEICNLKGEIGKDFEGLVERISVDLCKVRTWKIALSEVGGIAGFVVKDSR